MSRSTRKPIVKDKTNKRLYHRTIRRSTKNSFRKSTQELMQYSPQWLWEAEDEITEIEIPNPKTIVDDYDYCDYKFGYGSWWNWFITRGIYTDEQVKKLTRK